jgi:uncharacterized phage-associated protein
MEMAVAYCRNSSAKQGLAQMLKGVSYRKFSAVTLKEVDHHDDGTW